MATYNGEKFIAEQLDSLINQTYKDLEIIICDDGSTDRTVEIIQSYQQQDNRIRLFQNETNLGILKNFEKAISLSKGEYIALCDHDDIWMENKVEVMLGEIGDAVLAYHDDRLIDQDGTIRAASFYRHERIDITRCQTIRTLLSDNWISGHAVMFRRELKEKMLPIPEEFQHFDYWVVLIAFLNGSISYCNRQLVSWRQHGSNDSGNKLTERTFIEKLFFPIDRQTFILWNKSRIKRLLIIRDMDLLDDREEKVFLEQLINYYTLANRIKAFIFALRNIDHIIIRDGLLRKIKYILLPFFAPRIV